MSDSIEMLSKLLDATALRQKVIANNLANVNTPNFKRMDVRFKDALARAVQAGGSAGVSGVVPTVVQDNQSVCRPDGNNVTLQREIGEMAENSLLYQFSAKAVTLKFEGIRKAVRGR